MNLCSIRKNPSTFQQSTGDLKSTQQLLIHGYNNDDNAAITSYVTLEKNLDRLCTGLLWPGCKEFLEYPLAVQNAKLSGWRLKDLLSALSESDRQNLTIQTHSLGARVALEALNHEITINRLILSAPAVNFDAFRVEFSQVLKNVKRIDIAISSNDLVLRKDYYFGSFGGVAMGCIGPEVSSLTPNVFVHDFSSLVSTHSGYRDLPEYYQMWLKD